MRDKPSDLKLSCLNSDRNMVPNLLMLCLEAWRERIVEGKWGEGDGREMVPFSSCLDLLKIKGKGN